MAELATNTNKVLLSRADLKALGIWQSNSTLIRLEQAGRFPLRLRLSGACVCWDRDEIMEFIEARKAERADWHYANAE
ncbi:MAG: AlpA family phage regulatory protein [Pseudoruegeria sp.]